MDGIGLFTFESLKEIVVKHPTVDFFFIFDRQPHPDFLFADNITYHVIPPPTQHIFLLKIWNQFSLPRLIKKIKPDIFIGTDGAIPLNINCKKLAIIHDLNFEHYPHMLPQLIRKYYLDYFPQVC